MLGVVAVSLVVLYPLVEVIRIVAERSHRYLYGDSALIELSSRRAADFTQLVGPYSREGFHHPGPALFYLLAPFVALLGSGPGVYLGSMVISGATLVAITVLVWRWAGPSAALCTVVALDVFCLCVRVFTLREPWNPYEVVAPMALLGLLAAGAIVGRRGTWIWAAVVASYEAQTHLSTALVAVALIAVTGLVGVVRAGRRRRLFAGDRFARGPLIGVVALVAIWVAPAVEIGRDHPNNITRLWDFYTASHPFPTFAQALKAGANALAIVPFGNRDYVNVLTRPRWELAATAALLVVCWLTTLLVARRRASSLAGAITGTGVAIAVLGLASLTRAAGGVNAYFATWMSTAPVLSLVGLIVAAVGHVPDSAAGVAADAATSAPPPTGARRRAWPAPVAVAVPALGIVVAVVGTGLVLRSDLRMQSVRSVTLAPQVAVARFSRIIEQQDPTGRPVSFTIADFDAWPQVAGVVLEMDRRGTTSRVSPASWVQYFGRSATTPGPTARAYTFYSDQSFRAAPPPGATVLLDTDGVVLTTGR